LAWEQLDKTADETRLLCSYAGKKKDTVDFLESTSIEILMKVMLAENLGLTFLSQILMNGMRRHLNKRMRLIGTLLSFLRKCWRILTKFKIVSTSNASLCCNPALLLTKRNNIFVTQQVPSISQKQSKK